MSQLTALIIDDEPDIRELIAITLQRMDLHCYQAGTVRQALNLLKERRYHFCITDMKLPDGHGLDLIQLCNRQYPDMPIAMITAFGNMDLAISAMKTGAFDFVAKPLDIERLRELVNAALALTKVPVNINSLPSKDVLIGDTPLMMSLKQQLYKVARTQAPVCIQGPSGSGKNLVAQLLHHQSSRADHAVITVDCQHLARQQEMTLESLLQQAKSGTLILHNIDALTADLQAQLLTLLQHNPLHPNGQTRDVRLISSSQRNTEQLLANGIRQDLLLHLNVVQLQLPALSERRADIPLLAQHYLNKYADEWDMPVLPLSSKALDALLTHPFTNNVHELINIVQRAFSLAEGDKIELNDLQLTPNTSTINTVSTDSNDETSPIVPKEIANLEAYLENIERQAITNALSATRWNKTAAAEKLGISFRALRYRCKKLAID